MEITSNNNEASIAPFRAEGTVTIVGVGLISGSFALAMKEKGFAKHIIGVSRTEASARKAIELGIINEALTLEEAVKKSNFIYVAIPVDVTISVMRQIMDMITDKQIVVDAGSTKYALCKALENHPMQNVLLQRILCGERNTAVRKLR